MLVGYLDIGSKDDLGKPNFHHPTQPKPACCKTWSPWIPFSTILAQKLTPVGKIFIIPHGPNQPAARD
jgi:hypothetical protein